MVYSKDLVSVVSLVAQLVKKPPAMWETWAQSLSWEDPLEKEQLPSPVFWPGESPLCMLLLLSHFSRVRLCATP